MARSVRAQPRSSRPILTLPPPPEFCAWMRRHSRRWRSSAIAPDFKLHFTRLATARTTSHWIRYAAVVAANGPRDRRDRVEHAQVVAPEDFARFAQLDVIASMQPSHLLDDERWATGRLGPERSRGAYAWRTMEQHGVHLAFGTDHPVEPLNPLRGIYACVTRQLPQGSPSWQPQESLPMKDCLRAYTAGSRLRGIRRKTQRHNRARNVCGPGRLPRRSE